MAAMEPLSSLMGFSICKLSKGESLILEIELFMCVCNELKERYNSQHMDYFRLMNFTVEQENAMFEANFIRWIMRDILSSEEYTLEGIACYTDTHEDIVQEVFAGSNISPSANFLRRLFELHRSIRRDLYHAIMKKIIQQYLTVA